MTPADWAKVCRRVANEMEDCNMDGSALEAGADALLKVAQLEERVAELEASPVWRQAQRLRVELDEVLGEDCDANGYAPCDSPGRCLKCTKYDLAASRKRWERLREAAQAVVDSPWNERLWSQQGFIALLRAALAETEGK